MVSKKMKTSVHVARYVQVICGASAIIANAAAATENYGSATDLLTAAAALGPIIVLTGGVGLFAYHRPRDVHWHLTLVFDLLGVLIAGITSVMDIALLVTWYWWRGESWAANVAAATLSVFVLLASLLVSTQTRRLWRQSYQDAERGDAKHDWFHMVPPSERPDAGRVLHETSRDAVERRPVPSAVNSSM